LIIRKKKGDYCCYKTFLHYDNYVCIGYTKTECDCPSERVVVVALMIVIGLRHYFIVI